MNATFKRYLVSSLTTFGTAFLIAISVAIQVPGFTFSKASIVALITSAAATAVRAVAKALVEALTGVTGDAPASSELG